MKKIQLDVVGLTSGQTQGSYTLILGEPGSKRKLAIIIGSFEAQAIAIEIEKIVPVRPMTHDLIVTLANQYDVIISEVFIHHLQEGVFYAKIICLRDGVESEIDARTSDAISVAVRVKCPIYTTEEIMQEAGHEFNIGQEEEEEEEITSSEEGEVEDDLTPSMDLPAIGLSAASEEDLLSMLDEAESTEDYERAAIIRDELNKRRSS